MAANKPKSLKLTHSLVFLLITIMGFILSCKKETYVSEFTTPHAAFIVKGEVKSDVDSKIIPDMLVEILNVTKDQTGQSGSKLVDFDFSDSEGYYRLSNIQSTKEDQTYHVRFTDADGTLNGMYETLDTVIVFKNAKFTAGDGKLNLGSVVNQLNIKLKPIK